jgi:hypothetical protein
LIARLAAPLVVAACLMTGSASAQRLILGDPDTRPLTSGSVGAREYRAASMREVGDDRVINMRNGFFTIVRRPWVEEGGFCTSQIVREQFIQIGLDARRVVRNISSVYVHIPMEREECERRAAEFDQSSTLPSPFGQPDREQHCSHLYARICDSALREARDIAEQHRTGVWQNAFFSHGRGFTPWVPGATDREQTEFDRDFDELFQREELPIVTIETNGGRFARIECSRLNWIGRGVLICRVGDALYVDFTQQPFD